MAVGIEKINIYAGRLFLPIPELAEARGQDPHYIAQSLMCDQRSVYPPYEDAVTLAVNAAKRLLAPADLETIGLLIVGTESAVDMGKPVSTWVHRFCDLSPNCRNFEIKHACYGCTGALKMALAWVAAGVQPGKKALVINSDMSRRAIADQAEFISGGGAVALLISDHPQILEIDLPKAGYWTYEIADTFRPTSRAEAINDQASLYAYLDALEGAYSHYEQLAGATDVDAAFKWHIYHAPFPGMPVLAHRTLLRRSHDVSKSEAQQSFERKVSESLRLAKRVGSIYGGSTFLSLTSLITYAQDLQPGDPLSLFAYGSGCQGEFYSATLGPEALSVRSLNLEAHLDERLALSVTEYETLEKNREISIDQPDYEPPQDFYEKAYAGRQLLTLKQVESYQRRYQWS